MEHFRLNRKIITAFSDSLLLEYQVHHMYLCIDRLYPDSGHHMYQGNQIEQKTLRFGFYGSWIQT